MPKLKTLPCPRCAASMVRGSHSSGNAAGIAGALLVFCAGVIVFFIIPLLGWVIGPILCLLALFMGGKTTKVWKCKPCGYMTAIDAPTAYVPHSGSVAPAPVPVAAGPEQPQRAGIGLWIALIVTVVLGGLMIIGALVGE